MTYRATRAAWYAKNKTRHKALVRRWTTAHPERRREICRRYQLRKYGLTFEDYQQRFDAQGGLCAICRQPELERGAGGQIRLLSVDHDHQTGVVRGLLCAACNTSLGKMGDSPARLRAAAAYLEQYE